VFELPKNPVVLVLMTTNDQETSTFFKQVTIENEIIEKYPNTGDINRRNSSCIIIILMAMSLIGIGVLAFMMIEQNKTLH